MKTARELVSAYARHTAKTRATAWTLGAELNFYLLAPFILRSWKIALALLLASAGVRAYLVATTVFDGRWTYVFAPSTFFPTWAFFAIVIP
jgi:peptidoglycan/LPS O-acetylase OafA/YrhL